MDNNIIIMYLLQNNIVMFRSRMNRICGQLYYNINILIIIYDIQNALFLCESRITYYTRPMYKI